VILSRSWAPFTPPGTETANSPSEADMGVKLEPKPAPGKTGPERTKVHETKPSAMSQTTADIGDKFIAGGLASLKYENPGGYGAVKSQLEPTLGPGGVAAWEGEAERRVAKAREKPPKERKEVPAELMSKVLLTRLGAPLGMDPKKVEVVAESGYELKGSPAAFVDGQIYVNPGQVDPESGAGKEVVTHEAVHFAQSQNQLKKDLPAAEAEAAQIANLASLNQPLPKPEQGLPAGVPAAFQPFGAGPPDQVTLNLNGAELIIPTPGTVERDINVAVPASPIPGLVLTQANLKFDTEWSLEEGMLSGQIQTPWLSCPGVQLKINQGGGTQIEVTGADLTVGSLTSGTMDVVLTPEGVTGDAHIDFGAINLGMGLSLSEGFVEFHHTPDAQMKGLGTLKGIAEGLGAFTLGAEIDGETVGGRISVVVDQPVDLGGGVVLSKAVVSADFVQGGFELEGGAHVQLSDWAEGDLAAKIPYPGGSWSVAGTTNQMGGERGFGELSVSSATVGLTVSGGSLGEVTGRGHFVIPNFEGNLGGAYDIGADAFTGGGSVIMTEPLDLGDGTILKAVEGDLTVEGNTLVETKGKLKAEFAYEGLPSFDTELEGDYRFADQKFSGAGNLVTLRDLQLGPMDAYNAVVKAGSAATVTATDNRIERAEATWELVLNDAGGQVALGSASVQYDGQSFSGQGTFALTADIGYPDRAIGPVLLLGGSSLTVTFDASGITSIALDNAGFKVKSDSGQGELTGAGTGTLDPGVALATLDGQGQQESPVRFLEDKVELSAMGLSAKVENDVLTESAGQVAVAVQAVGGLTGQADFTWNKKSGADDYEFDGVIDYKITEEIGGTVDILYQGGTLSIEGANIDSIGKLDEVAELVRRVLDVASVTTMMPPFTLELIPAYLAYRVWVLKDLDLGQLQAPLRSLWTEIQASFGFLLEFLPEWLKQVWSWIESGSPNVLADMGQWLSENLKSLGQTAIDWLLDMGEWGGNVIRGAGPWAVEAAGWGMETISDAGEAVGTAAGAAWDWLAA
jgi:hypothetical protein